MARKLYKRLGLRRERNLSDISNTVTALNNIIGPLADIDGATFINEDLNCIRGLSETGISTGDFRALSDLTLVETDESGIEQVVTPLKTIKNRVDILQITAGDPRLNGGPGIFPEYYETVIGDGFTDNIVSGAPTQFSNIDLLSFEWLNGSFEFDGRLYDNSSTSKGALVWEGYFVPTDSGTHLFTIITDGYVKLEFEDDNYTGVGINTYKTVINSGISTTIDAGTVVSSNRINVQEADAVVVGTGLSITGPNINANATIETRNNKTTYTLSGGGVNADAADFNTQVNLIKQGLGSLITQHKHFTRPLNGYRKYFFKLTYFIPDSISESEADTPHFIRLELNAPGGTGAQQNFPYYFLYPLDYDFSDFAAGSFEEFSKTKIPKSGGEIGGTSNSSEYVTLQTSAKIKINYVPPSSKSSILKRTITTGITTASFIEISETSNIEPGNYVLDVSGGSLGINTGTRVTDVFTNNTVVFDQGGLVEKTATLEFLDHRGFVKSVEGEISGTTLTINNGNTDNLKSGMLVVGDGVTNYTGITTTGSSTQVTVSPSQTVAVGAGTTLYFYESKGLINDSLISFCPTTENVCLISNGVQTAGSTTLSITDTTGVSQNMFVYGLQFPPGTTITNFNVILNTITISNPITVALADGANFTASTSSEVQKALCCPPTDTSPPFDATEEGIATVGGATTLSVPGTFTFDSISIGSSEVTTSYANESSTNVLTIETGGGNYNILCL